MYKAFDEGKNILSVDLEDNEAILTFLKTNSVPLMDEIGPDNYSSYVELGVPIAFFFYSSPEERKLGSVFDSIAKKHKGVVSFAYIDAVKFGGHAKSLNVKEDWPALGIQNPTTQAKFPYDKSLGFTEKALSKFFQDFVDGKLVSSQKSEPVPEDNSGPVKIIVGKNFNEIALDKKHDVFVEIYAPWCM